MEIVTRLSPIQVRIFVKSNFVIFWESAGIGESRNAKTIVNAKNVKTARNAKNAENSECFANAVTAKTAESVENTKCKKCKKCQTFRKSQISTKCKK